MNCCDFMFLIVVVLIVFVLGYVLVDYIKGLIEKYLVVGDIVYVDFKIDWCLICCVMVCCLDVLCEENVVYDENIVFIDVDFDCWGGSSLIKKWGVLSCLIYIVLKGDQELGCVYVKSFVCVIGGLLDIVFEVVIVNF